MEQIKNINELIELAVGEKFYVISSGQILCYNYVGKNPMTKEMVIGVWDANVKTCRVFNELDFDCKQVFVKGKYSGKYVGEIMVKQLQEKITSIQTIYTS